MSLTEDQALEILSAELSVLSRQARAAGVSLGIGDDGAVVGPADKETVWSVDSCEEGVHFLWEWMSPEDVAHKSFHSAASDVAAMGADPKLALCHLTLGPGVTRSWLRRFAKTQGAVAAALRMPIIGGNVSFSDATRVVMTVAGEASEGTLLVRSGARPGDEVWLLGPVGLARAGLLLLRDRPQRARGRGAAGRALEAFRCPTARFAEARRLRGRAHSCLDISDGLARDAGQLARASGVRLMLDETHIVATLQKELLVLAERWGVSALSLALEGGEDYALLATGPSSKRPRGAQPIGQVEAISAKEKPGVFLQGVGSVSSLRGGFVHRSTKQSGSRGR